MTSYMIDYYFQDKSRMFVQILMVTNTTPISTVELVNGNVSGNVNTILTNTFFWTTPFGKYQIYCTSLDDNSLY